MNVHCQKLTYRLNGEKGDTMRMVNQQGQAVYYNCVEKRGALRYIIKAASGQDIPGRDRQKLKNRTFTQEHQAEAWLKRNGYRNNP